MTIDELFARVPAPTASIDEQLREQLEGEIGDAELLDLVYTAGLDDEDTEALEAWLETVLAGQLAADEAGAVRWCGAALGAAWTRWQPVLAAAPGHDEAAVAAQVAIAAAASSTGDELAHALAAVKALPSLRSPPAYVGHFYGALLGLLDGRVGRDYERFGRLAACLSFACVAPDGSRQTAAVVAAR